MRTDVVPRIDVVPPGTRRSLDVNACQGSDLTGPAPGRVYHMICLNHTFPARPGVKEVNVPDTILAALESHGLGIRQ